MKFVSSISSLPISAQSAAFAPTNSADVSAIASAYAQSAASGKLDSTAQVVTSIDYAASMISPDLHVQTLNGYGIVAAEAYSAHTWIDASSKQDTLSFEYDDNKISAINGSALAGQGGGGSVASPSGTIIVTDGTAIEATNSAIGTAEGFDVNNSGQANIAVYPSTYEYLGSYSPFKARGIGLTYNSSTATRTAWVSANTTLGNLVSSFVIPASSISAGGLLSTSNIDSIWDSQLRVEGGSLTLSGSYPVLFTYPGLPYSAVRELAWASAIPTYSYDSEDKISAINGSAIAGGVDSATVSAIASSYAESAASGKLDASASSSFYSTGNPSGFITGVDLSPYQTTADMSGYMSTSMSSDFQQVTGMSSYALSSDVSATVDLVGTQSANWGGSALQLSAGPGVKLEKSGNVLVASTDETVLWSGSGYSVGDTMQTYNLSADPSDFEEIQVYGQRPLGATDTMGAFEFRFHPAYLTANSVSKICVPLAFVAGGSVTPYIGGYSVIDINTTSWHDGFTWQYQPTTTYQGTSYIAHIHKIVGINRTAGF